jgi:LmbE family N-acetylglucosaminyl deacetylase
MSILVVAAHPDDEVLGCGGTISRAASEGEDVYVAILGEGITSRFDRRDEVAREAVERLHETARAVNAELGARKTFLYSLPDNRFDTVPLLDIVKIVEQLLSEIRPREVFTHHPGDLNIDHSIAFRAVLTATRPMADHQIESLYSFEIPSSSEWSFQQLATPFTANFFVDIGGTLQRKVAAMEKYAGESRPFPHPRSSAALSAIAQRWGSVVGLHAAEAFQLIRTIVSPRARLRTTTP